LGVALLLRAQRRVQLFLARARLSAQRAQALGLFMSFGFQRRDAIARGSGGCIGLGARRGGERIGLGTRRIPLGVALLLRTQRRVEFLLACAGLCTQLAQFLVLHAGFGLKSGDAVARGGGGCIGAGARRIELALGGLVLQRRNARLALGNHAVVKFAPAFQAPQGLLVTLAARAPLGQIEFGRLRSLQQLCALGLQSQ